MNYRLAYAVGFHPWEALVKHEPYAGALLELVDREEGASGPPFGSALDIGTGSGVWGVELAKRGWDVTGVDNVEKALARARARVETAGVQMRLVPGDVTALSEAGVGSGYRLVLDTGTFHGLADEQRAAMGSEVTAVAGPDATISSTALRLAAGARCRVAPAETTSSVLSRTGRSRTSLSPTPRRTRSRGCSSSTNASTGSGGSESQASRCRWRRSAARIVSTSSSTL